MNQKRITPGAFFKALRVDRGFTQRGLAQKMGVSHSTISKIENNDRSPKFEILEKYASALRVNLTYLIAVSKDSIIDPKIPPEDMQEEIDNMMRKQFNVSVVDNMIEIPLVGVVKAGNPIIAIENIEEYITIDRSKLSPEKTYYALRVNGDSMDKLFPAGTTLVVEKTEGIENGQIAVVGVNGYEATVKKVAFGEDNIALIPKSNNPAYKTQVYNLFDEDIHIMGRVVQAITYF